MNVIAAILLPAMCLPGVGSDTVQRAKRLTAEDIRNLTWVIQTEVSPDGRHVFYSVLGADDEGRRGTTSWLCASEEGSEPNQVFADIQGVNSVAWSPDGSKLALLARDDDSGGRQQIFVTQGNAAHPRRLTAMESGVIRFRWAADSRTLGFVAGERPKQLTSIEVVGSRSSRSALWTIGLEDTSARRITGQHQNVIDFAWSPSGDRFAATLAEAEDSDIAVPPVQLVLLDRGDGHTVRRLTDQATGGCDLAWSPDGQWIAASIAAPRKLSRRLALFPAAGGEPTFPFADYHATPMSHVEWTSDARYLFVQFTEQTRNQLIRLEPATGELEHFSDDLKNFWGFGMDRNGEVFSFTAESQHDPPDVFVRNRSRLHRMTDFNAHLKDYQLGDVTTIRWNSSIDDRTIYGVLITPPGFVRGRPCPMIVNLHSGPHWFWWEGWVGTYLSWGQYLASHGYAVFLPNHRGSIGRGWEFAEAHYLEWGRGDYQDVLDGVDMLVAQKVADPARLGIGGSSFGGYLTAQTITQTNRFQAAVVDAGWFDLVSSNLSVDVPEPMRLYMNGSELERTDLYRSRSPLTFINKCRTPTLILHGENDRRVPVDQGRMLHRALQLNGVETRLVIYRGEGHGLSKPEHQLDSLRRVKNWFDQHLNVH